MEMDFISRNLPHHDHDFWNRDQHNYDFSKSPLGHQHQNNFSEYSSSQINDFSKSPTRSSLGLKDSAANTCSRSNSSITMLNPRTTPLETCFNLKVVFEKNHVHSQHNSNGNILSCLGEKNMLTPNIFPTDLCSLVLKKTHLDLALWLYGCRRARNARLVEHWRLRPVDTSTKNWHQSITKDNLHWNGWVVVLRIGQCLIDLLER